MEYSFIDLSNARADRLSQNSGQPCQLERPLHSRYQVLKVLGKGGFGITFLAKDIALPSEPLCVVKRLSLQMKDPKAIEKAHQRFIREAEMLGKLGGHSQIPCLLDYFELKGRFYLVQEYIHGSTLAREIRRSGPQSEAVVQQFLHQLLPLLHYVHQHRVIHRDIKPQNLIRAKDDGRLVLIDFGAVKEQLVQTSRVGSQVPLTQFIGTKGFAAPEQVAMHPVYASDIYAVGMVCICLLTGKPPVDLQSHPKTGQLLWQEQIQVSDRFAKVIDKMLSVSLQDRYHSAKEVLRALDLEAYLPTLTSCLSVQARPLQTPDEGITEYVSPAAREAMSVRQWHEKQRIRQKRADSYLSL